MTGEARCGLLAFKDVNHLVPHECYRIGADNRRDTDRRDRPDAGGDHGQPQRQQPRGRLVHQMLTRHRPARMGHHTEIDSADLSGRDRHLEYANGNEAPSPVVRPHHAHPAFISGGPLVDACHDLVDQVWPLAGLNRGQPASLHGGADQPGAATAARFQMGIDLLREHLGTLAVQSRRKRLTRYVTPHPCIVAAWPLGAQRPSENRWRKPNQATGRRGSAADTPPPHGSAPTWFTSVSSVSTGTLLTAWWGPEPAVRVPGG